MEERRGLFIEIYDQYENFAFKRHEAFFFLQVDFFCNCGTLMAFSHHENHLNIQLGEI